MGLNTFRIEVAGITRELSVYINDPEILDGFWSDPKNGSSIKEAFYGDKVKFTVSTKDIKDGTKLNFTLFDYDGNYNPDDELDRSFSVIVKNNMTELEFTPNIKWKESAKYETDKVVETYFEIETDIKGKIIKQQLPKNKEDYLILYDQEVKITLLVELPHSLETGWGAKGLAGHTAMAIGDQYFDYGPDYRPSTLTSVDENQFDYDFNSDGDKNDILDLTGKVNHEFAPGRPWWGEMVAGIQGINADQVTLDMVSKFILLPYTQNNVYGEVHKIEFYVNKEQAENMLNWWNNRYQHFKAYSVYPWTGEQCTTAVKSALQSGNVNIPDVTQKPIGILNDFKNIILSTSTKHRGQKPIINIIKKESKGWKPSNP